jgi:ATP-dependent Clp protease ATP-binding subunit ClpB
MTASSERYAPETRRAFIGAEALAKDLGHLTIEPLHLLRELLETEEDLWKALRADRRDLTSFVDVRLARLPRRRGGPSPTPSKTLTSVVERAIGLSEVVGPPELLLAISQLSSSDDASALLKEFNISNKRLQELIGGSSTASKAVKSEAPRPKQTSSKSASSGSRASAKAPPKSRPAAEKKAPSGEPEYESDYDPLLHFGTDLTEVARQGGYDPIVGRSVELRRVMQVLARRKKNNPILIGEAGVGKRTIAQALARRIVLNDVPDALRDRRIVSVEPGALLAGARMRGELESRIKSIVDSLRDSQGKTILFAEELSSLLGAGGQAGSVGTGEMLKPALARGEVRIIGRTTPQDYKTHIEKDPTLARCFQPVPVEEPKEKESIAIMRGVVERYEIHHGVRISDPACIAAVRYAKRYLSDRCLPDVAIDLIDEAAARLRMQIDSIPAELDELERKLEALQIEHESLHDDLEVESQAHRKAIEVEIGELIPRARDLRQRWRIEKETLDSLRATKLRLNDARREESTERGTGNLNRAGELRFSIIPQLEQEVLDIEEQLAASKPLVREAVSEADIAETISDWTGIPVNKMLEDEAERLLAMESNLQQRVVGQDNAVELVSKAVRRGRVGLRDPGRPIGSFLFLGPTGVGKTELGKALAEFLFNDEAAITRIDMSEFMERHMVARLVGAPPGYVDSDDGGYLTEAVRAKPYSVILLDEIEKAHRDVFDLLLQVLDDGRLTDGRGRTVSFSNAVIIMTSNIAGHKILDHDGDEASLRSLIESELLKILRPEFLNRIDDVVIFNKLTPEALTGIVHIQARRLSKILEDYGMSLELTDRCVALLVERGYNPAFGARPVRRVILKEIQDPLAEQILKSGYGAGDKVVVDAEAGRFTFSLAPKS